MDTIDEGNRVGRPTKLDGGVLETITKCMQLGNYLASCRAADVTKKQDTTVLLDESR